MLTHSLVVAPEFSNVRLDVFLTQNLENVPSRSFVQKLIEAGQVTIDSEIVKANYKVTEGETVEVILDSPLGEAPNIPAENIPLDIFYEDDHLLIINKPIGMMVHPATGIYTGTLVNALLHHCQNLSDLNKGERAGIVHRLDKETSGLMIVAKDNLSHARLAKQFEKHEVKKRYIALVEGRIEFDQGMVEAALGRHPIHREKKAVSFDDSAKDAVTYYEVLKRIEDVTLVALFPKTGRTHQLRVHMAHLRHPILGDDKYGRKTTFPRLALHAQSIGFTHPITKQYIEFSSKIPKEFLERVHFRSTKDIEKLINN
jgi:23S rRNA pseudouridine1911/1915/1917 synthase